MILLVLLLLIPLPLLQGISVRTLLFVTPSFDESDYFVFFSELVYSRSLCSIFCLNIIYL